MLISTIKEKRGHRVCKGLDIKENGMLESLIWLKLMVGRNHGRKCI